jgi:ComF family protein
VGQALDLLFPNQCLGCGRAGVLWCPVCDASLERIAVQLCGSCGRPLARRGICSECRRRPPPYQARSYAVYHGPLAKAIVSLKYRPNRRLANLMGGWLGRVYAEAGWQAQVIVPVPLGRQRQRRRGYNQAHLLALALREQLRLPVEAGRLRRVQETPSQVGLMPEERRENVREAFLADPGAGQNDSILLIDDLYTTGATLAACATALRQVGVAQVFALTVARA